MTDHRVDLVLEPASAPQLLRLFDGWPQPAWEAARDGLQQLIAGGRGPARVIREGQLIEVRNCQTGQSLQLAIPAHAVTLVATPPRPPRPLYPSRALMMSA